MPRFLSVKCIFNLLITIFCASAPLLQVPDTTGQIRTPCDLGNHKAAVLIFVAIDCPISNSYAPEINRIIADDKDKGIAFYVVYSDPKVSNEDVKKHARDFGYTCPALLDHDQALMKHVGATVTPQVAVVGADDHVLYQGRIDNWYEDLGKQRYTATTHDLRDTLDSIIAGKKIATPVTKAVGCPI